MNFLQNYREELVRERNGDSRLFSSFLKVADRIFFVFVGLAIAAIAFGFYEAERISIDSSSAASQKGWAIFLGFIGSAVLLAIGIIIKGLFLLVLTDRKHDNG